MHALPLNDEQAVFWHSRSKSFPKERFPSSPASLRQQSTTLYSTDQSINPRLRPKDPTNLFATQFGPLYRLTSTGNHSARELQCMPQLSVPIRRDQQLLSSSGHLIHRKMKSFPPMTAYQKNLRYQFAKDHVPWGLSDCTGVIFPGEKKFILDGPDGFAHYWHDIRNEPRVLSTRQKGRKSVMV